MRPGDQHKMPGANFNPFEERQVEPYTAIEIATLQAKLDQQLGPEFVSSRPGAGGQKVQYIMAEKCINLANQVFGFNGWSSSISGMEVDFVDQAKDGRWSIGVSVTVRVTLKDGTYHEDVGYGTMENGKTKATVFAKAKKEGTTDALKRALRTFGNVLGLCLYDKEYLKKIKNVKAAPPPFDEKKLHRHTDVVTPPTWGKANPPTANATTSAEVPPAPKSPSLMSDDSVDEYGGDEFDELGIFAVENNPFDELMPDEVILQEPSKETIAKGPGDQPKPIVNAPPIKNAPQPHPPAGRPAVPHPAQQPSRPVSNMPPPPAHAQGGFVRPQPQQNNQNQRLNGPGGRPAQYNSPMTPSKPEVSNNAGGPHPQSGFASKPVVATAAQAAEQPKPPQNGQNVSTSTSTHNPPVGFFTARAAAANDEGASSKVVPDTSPFNPHRPTTIPRSSGIDHTKSSPITRNQIPAQSPRQAPSINFDNPSLNANRQIGMPPSNRGAFKAPGPSMAGTKRPADNGNWTAADRSALGNASTGQINAQHQGDPKRAKHMF